jgi:diguanylate cyclase (GGDEF)-like protein
MPKQLSITVRTVLFVAIVCFSFIAVDGWRSWKAREVQLAEMNTAASNLARAMASQAESTVKEADITLVGMVERVESDGTSPKSLQRLHRLLVTRHVELPQLNGLFIYDENGKWVVDSQPVLLSNFNNSDREYFVYHRTHSDSGVHVGVPVRSRSTGQWIIPVSRRIDHPDGSFAGVALATLDVAYFLKFYDSLDVGRNGAVALISEQGLMMARRPFSDDQVGRAMINTELFRAYQSQGPVGTTFISSAQDHVMRLNSFRKVGSYPMFVTAALSKQEILADWWQGTLLHSSGVVLLAAVLAGFGWRLIRQIELRTQAEAEVTRARDALEKLNTTLEKLAMQDGLTGLANRRQFDVTLADEFSRATRNASMLSLIMMDVDSFKQYNDIYGHAAGDECLRTICRTVQALTPHRPGNLAARYGGEEIAVLLPNTDVKSAVQLAETIRNAVLELKIEHRGNTRGYVTLSAGVDTRVPTPGMHDRTVLIRSADQALYRAKDSGRNQVCISPPTPEPKPA